MNQGPVFFSALESDFFLFLAGVSILAVFWPSGLGDFGISGTISSLIGRFTMLFLRLRECLIVAERWNSCGKNYIAGNNSKCLSSFSFIFWLKNYSSFAGMKIRVSLSYFKKFNLSVRFLKESKSSTTTENLFPSLLTLVWKTYRTLPTLKK